MNLSEEILKEHSKKQCDKIVNWVGNDKKKFTRLFNLFLTGEYRVTQRAAWPLSDCAIAHPGFMKNNFGKLINNLKRSDLHDSVKRNSVRLLQAINIPGRYDGDILDICFRYLASPDEAVAVKAFSLTILERLSKKYPEIKSEIKLLIEEQWLHQSPAFKNRARVFMNN
jgi:hypothetical protein